MLLEAHHQSMGGRNNGNGQIVFAMPVLIAGVLNLVFSIALARRLGFLV